MATPAQPSTPQAFNALTPQDFVDTGWNMDTSASSHLDSNANNLSNMFNKSIYPSVFVRDGNNTRHLLKV